MRLIPLALALAALLVMPLSALAQDAPAVAGLRPYERPAGAPRVADRPRSAEQVAHGLRGISAPVPGNLQSIAATGNWYSPIRYRGMAPPYDLRGLHGSPQPPQLSDATAPSQAGAK